MNITRVVRIKIVSEVESNKLPNSVIWFMTLAETPSSLSLNVIIQNNQCDVYF